MRIIIAGSRSFDNYGMLKEKCLYAISESSCTNIEIVSGGAKGADQLGEWFANEFHYPLKIFKADWSIGKSAGYLRNVEMAKYASENPGNGMCILFWDGLSKGTKSMKDIAEKYNLNTFVFNFEE